MQILSIENAANVKRIRNIANPGWGVKRFNYNEQPLNDGRFASTFGIGSNSAVLFESEYKFWEVVEMEAA